MMDDDLINSILSDMDNGRMPIGFICILLFVGVMVSVFVQG